MASTTPARPSPLDLLWSRPRVVLWLMLAAEGLALVLTLALGVSAAFRFFGAISLAAQVVLLGTVALLYALRHRLGRLSPPRIAIACAASFLALTITVAVATGYVFGPAVAMDAGAWTELILRLVGIVTVVAALGVTAFVNYWRYQGLAIRTKQAELEALQARIRPHFLFNTLNTATALVHHRPEDAERMLLDLADLFRAALAGPRQVGLAEELDLVRRYLEIESHRFGERLRVEWALPAALPQVQVPSLSLQPLVENAIRHGIERAPGGGVVTISISEAHGQLLVQITSPHVAAPAPAHSHRVGLSATRARIEAMTGGRGGIDTGIVGDRFVATARLPCPPRSAHQVTTR